MAIAIKRLHRQPSHPGEEYDDKEIKRGFKLYYGDDKKRVLQDGQMPLFREEWSSLSEFWQTSFTP